MRVIILAAGLGSRLGTSTPKCLTMLPDGETILQRQVNLVRKIFGNPQITVVVGYSFGVVMRDQPNVNFVYNNRYSETNTAKSLLKALQMTKTDDTIWMNGDVVFDIGVLELLRERIRFVRPPLVLVQKGKVGDEEIKYASDDHGCISALSKTVPLDEALGEGIGINFIPELFIGTFMDALNTVGDQDYFEAALELMIDRRWALISPLDVTSAFSKEVDFEEDLEAVFEWYRRR